MEQAGPSTRSVRRVGLVLALSFALVAAGAIGILLLRANQRPAADPAAASATSGITSAPPAVDVAEIGLKNAGRARFQFVDKADPTRVLGVMEWAALDPQGGGRAVVREPRATIFLSGGRVAHVRAARGRIFTPPKSDQPESGTFEGGVPVAIFEPRPDGTVDVEADTPVALLFTPGLSFNLALGEVSAPDEFRLSTPRVEMSGRGLRIVGNQVRQQIELLEIESTDYVRIASGSAAGTEGLVGQGAAPTDDTPSRLADRPRAEEARDTHAPGDRETFYHAVVDSRVRLRRGTLTLSADRIEFWAALRNNALAPDALGAATPWREAPVVEARRADRLPGAVASGRAARPRATLASFQPRWHPGGPGAGVDPRANEPASLYRARADQAELTWFGPLTVKPLDARPDELRQDELALRLTSDQTGVVSVADESAGLRAQCAWVDYGATSRDLTLSGGGPKGVVLTGEGRGRLEVPTLTANLASGKVRVDGPGVMLAAGDERASPAVRRSAADTPARSRQVSWNRRADLTLAVADGWITDRIKDASFTGKVLAEDPRGTLSAGFARASFEPSRAAGARTPAFSLSRIVASDSVALETGQNASLRSQSLDVVFAASAQGGTPDPVSLAATGEVSARRDRWRLDAGALIATLTRESRGGVGVAGVRAQADVRLTGDRLSVRAERAEVDTTIERAELWGGEAAASIARDGGAVTGPHMVVDGRERSLVVAGPGTFRFVRERAAGSAPDVFGGGSPLAPALGARPSSQVRVDATWTERLTVDEDAGTVEAVGAATAVSSPTSAEMDTLNADRIALAFTPLERAAPDAAPGPHGEAPQAVRRQLLRAEATGSEGALAHIDSRRFAESVGDFEDRTLERIIYIEGTRLVASDEASTMTVPGAGRLLVDDRRASKGRANQPQGAGPLELTGSRGTSVFSWVGSLRFDRRAGELVMDNQVRLLHRASPGDPVTSLECERLASTMRTASRVRAAGDAAPAPGQQTELVSAKAEGAVVVRSAQAQLVADRLTYDALRQSAQAAANPENRVTFFDPSRPQPVTAARLEWDIVRNKVRVIEPSSVSVPGGARLPGR